ncbi:unnamed protein product [Urochloa decumbens]|uniref:Uncharacterized protein n=1 Tax=Urochloa decumbens TaxID=240449 RepID=A0ABC8XHY8_9POAL
MGIMAMAMACLLLGRRMPIVLGSQRAKAMRNKSVSIGAESIGMWITDRDSETWALSLTTKFNSDGLSWFTDARSPDAFDDYTLSENAGSVQEQELLMENRRLRLEIVRMKEEIKESTDAWLATATSIGDARRFLSCFLPPDSSSANSESRTRVRVQGTIDHQDFFRHFVRPDRVGAPLPHFNERQY